MLTEVLLSTISILLSVAFLTLLERKILSYSQNRVGPNKVFIMGMIQPVLDGIKLLTKELTVMVKNNSMLFLVSPILSFMIMEMFWWTLPEMFSMSNSNLTFLIFLILVGLGVYSIMFMGWASNSKFSMIGAIRACSQSISYEISFSVLVLSIMMVICNFNISTMLNNSWLILMIFPIYFLWMISILAETNRAPFDFSEGESELVSGFNVEYGSGVFAIIMVSEYGMVLMFSLMSSILITGNSMFMFLFWLMFSWLILLIRAVYPRLRYDKLMNLAWTKLLPMSILFLFLVILIL